MTSLYCKQIPKTQTDLLLLEKSQFLSGYQPGVNINILQQTNNIDQ